MIIRIYDSEDHPTPQAQGLVDFLSQFRGPWKFEVGSAMAEPGDYYEDEDFDPTTSDFIMADVVSMTKSMNLVEDWDGLFERINKVSKRHRNSDFSILITSQHNAFNWFSGIEPNRSAPLGFIQGIYWHHWVESELMYPLLYECVALPLRYRMFNSALELQNSSHMRAIGCVNDWCEHHEDVILRLQTGSLCNSCMDRALKSGITHEELDQVDVMLDAIRIHFRAFNRRRAERKPTPVRVEKQGRRIYIGDSLLQIRPLEKALYLFFLQTDSPMRTQDLENQLETLEKLYSPLYNGSNPSDMKRIVQRLALNEDGLTNQAVSRINRAIDQLVIPELAPHYKIETDSKGFKRVQANMDPEGLT